MKKEFLLVLVLIALFGCSDEWKLDENNPVKGKWINEIYTDVDGCIYDPNEKDKELFLNFIKLEFNDDFTASYKTGYVDSEENVFTYYIYSGKYMIEDEKVIFDNGMEYIFKVSKNKLNLTLIPGEYKFMSPFHYEYTRQTSSRPYDK